MRNASGSAILTIAPFWGRRNASAPERMAAAIFRMFSVYGAGLRKQLPWELGGKLLRGSGPVELFGTGGETRDFFAVTDAARAIVTLASTPHPSPLIVNGGTGVATTVADFATGFAEALKVSREIRFTGQARTGDPQHFCADITRMKSLGLEASVSLRQGLPAYAGWLRSIASKI